MPAKLGYSFFLSPVGFFLVALVICLFSLPLSNALHSAGLALMGGAVLFEWLRKRTLNLRLLQYRERMHLWLPLGLFALICTDLFRPDISAQESADLIFSRIAYVLIPLAVGVFHYQLNDRLFNNVLKIFAAFLFIIGLISVLRYFQNREMYDALLLQSKHIPVYGGMNHIYFSLTNAFIICQLIFTLPPWSNPRKRFSFFLSIVLIAGLTYNVHVLSARTGLFVMYSGLGLTQLIRIWKSGSGSFKKMAVFLALILIVPVTAYLTMSSLQRKVANTVEDAQSIMLGGTEMNHKSMAMRLESYRVGGILFSENWTAGVGKNKVKTAMQDAYVRFESPLFPENRIEPHNQFLHFGIAFGVMGLFIFLLFWILPFFELSKNLHPVFLALLIIFFLASMLEPILERQNGMFLFFFFYFWYHEKQTHEMVFLQRDE